LNQAEQLYFPNIQRNPNKNEGIRAYVNENKDIILSEDALNLIEEI
jgi:hypothetical protein